MEKTKIEGDGRGRVIGREGGRARGRQPGSQADCNVPYLIIYQRVEMARPSCCTGV